ncbi:hypothetical protein ABIA09_005731 [Bradyrhizobium yuanmingense]
MIEGIIELRAGRGLPLDVVTEPANVAAQGQMEIKMDWLLRAIMCRDLLPSL